MAANERVLITGGAGFVGSHLADALAMAGHRVILFDNLESQVHGASATTLPDYLDRDHELVRGDIRDAEALAPHVRTADVVFHLAALVGVGQSMYQVHRYTDVNAMGTASLLQVLADHPGRVRELIVASSMSVYGEGAYICRDCGPVNPRLRSHEQLAAHDWEPRCPNCRAPLLPVATGEDKALFPASIYAVHKRAQEEMFLTFSHAYGIPAVALRFFNIYGSRQALSNPYTGVAANFSAQLLAGNRPLIFEDGNQTRDFVHVSDVVQACRMAMSSPDADYQTFNVGTGRRLSVLHATSILARELGCEDRVDVTQKFRAGDIRHCFADITRIQRLLGYRPRVRFEDGAGELVRWVSQQQGVKDAVAEAMQQLTARGLTR